MNEMSPDPLFPADTLSGATLGADPLARLARAAVLARLADWREGSLKLRLPDGERLRFGAPGATPVVRAHVTRAAAFRKLLFGGEIGIGQAYVDGDWWAEDLPLCQRMFIRNLPTPRMNAGLARLTGAWNALRHHLRANTRAGSRRNIRAHYDLGNDFYRLCLDESLTYFLGLFPTGGETLEEAQRIKLERVVDALALRPEHHLLEIGCGWGSLALAAAARSGCRVTGLTLSREQHDLARARVAAAGLADRIDIRLLDYRDLREQFDRVVSIEMFEAVGYAYYDDYFATLDRVLKPGGRAFLQTITVPDAGFHAYRMRSDWIRRHVFPGSLLASVAEVRRSLRRSTRLSITHLDEIGPHYVPTLRAWRRRFHERLGEVRALGYDARFIRLWDYYLASCEAGFAERLIGNVQMTLARPGEGER